MGFVKERNGKKTVGGCGFGYIHSHLHHFHVLHIFHIFSQFEHLVWSETKKEK